MCELDKTMADSKENMRPLAALQPTESDNT